MTMKKKALLFSALGVLALMVCCGLIFLTRQRLKYSNLTPEFQAAGAATAGRLGIGTDEFLAAKDVRAYLDRFPKRNLPAEEWDRLMALKSSKDANVRIMTLGAFNHVFTGDQLVRAKAIKRELAQNDPDIYVRVGALTCMAQAHDPDSRAIAQADLRLPTMPPQLRIFCQAIIDGNSLKP